MKRSFIVGVIVVILIIGFGFYGYSSLSKKNLIGCIGENKLSFDETTGEDLGECCEGLVEIGNVFYDDTKTCEEIFMMVGYGSICSDCGNENCEEWENKCNCPEDCK